MQIYFRDGFIDEVQAKISVNDRSFRFGDGIFETAIIANGKVWDWERHAKRLASGMEFYELKLDARKIPEIAAQLIATNKITTGYLRVIISRGMAPGVGYQVENPAPYMIVQVNEKPLPEYKAITLLVAKLRAYYRSPCKTNNALLYTRVIMEAAAAKCDNALLLSHDDYVCETSNGNIFWIKGNKLFTPSIDLPLIPGTLRDQTLKLWTGAKNEGRYTLEDLRDADEIFMTNVGGIVSTVSEIKPLGIKPPSSVKTQKLRQVLMKSINSA